VRRAQRGQGPESRGVERKGAGESRRSKREPRRGEGGIARGGEVEGEGDDGGSVLG
jgi:hypothetical protein